MTGTYRLHVHVDHLLGRPLRVGVGQLAIVLLQADNVVQDKVDVAERSFVLPRHLPRGEGEGAAEKHRDGWGGALRGRGAAKVGTMAGRR